MTSEIAGLEKNESAAVLNESSAAKTSGAGVEFPFSDVDHGTISTGGTATLGNHKDGSVISAITDHASLEGPVDGVRAAAGINHVVSQPDPAVPQQVILADEGPGASADEPASSQQSIPAPPATPAHPPSAAEPLIATRNPPDTQSTVSNSVLPDPPASLDAEPATSLPRSTSEGMTTPSTGASTNPLSSVSARTDDMLDDYIRSPEVQNAIVERSPGGRYVRFMEKLGSGASKDVYRAYDTHEGIEVAWNVVTLSGVPKSERNRIVNEVRLLERLHHHNIISFHGSWVNRERQEVNFVTEILSSGTLKSFINKVQVIRWKIAKRWGIQILNGLAYLHSQEPPVIHRDLKCENVFINGTSGDIRIGDLGLSTVHRNGRVLSVLGTPEFMAPDMYEEQPYDEKVDIYAFGMCMLEILTKEIPYVECNNPAQIYKKVIAGEQPEVLSRLQSRHARDFVMLCLGYKDENGKYIRPSAEDLLKHPFLMKRPNDDDEVIVERPLREDPIMETSESLHTAPALEGVALQRSAQDVASLSHKAVDLNSQTQTGFHSARQEDIGALLPSGTPAGAPVRRRQQSFTEEDDDQFNRMPESETNMKKIKVLMGRGQELQEDQQAVLIESSEVFYKEDQIPPAHPPASAQVAAQPILQQQIPPPPIQPQPQIHQQQIPQPPIQQQPQIHQQQIPQQQPQQQIAQHMQQPQAPMQIPVQQGAPQQPENHFHYLVAAAVLENEEAQVTRPYADDILKLVVTLPVEGQTQNVQFDFHLVLDDPVKVAKEMVQELEIPQGAVLEISETISGLACSARMKQDKFTSRMNDQTQVRQVQPTNLVAVDQVQTQVAGDQAPQLQYQQSQNASYAAQENARMQDQQQYAQRVVPTASSPTGPAPIPAQNQQMVFAQGIPTPGPQNVQQIPVKQPHVVAPANPEVGSVLLQQDQSASGQFIANSPSSQPPDIPAQGANHNPEVDVNQPSVVENNASKDGDNAGFETDDDFDEDDFEINEKLRKLEEDYQKNLKIAKKVFDNRMDSLQRSQVMKEAQHRKTLEKHEKERAEFEKRRALEEEQQMRRIEQLQKEWDLKRETLAQQRKNHVNTNGQQLVTPQHPVDHVRQPDESLGMQQRLEQPGVVPASMQNHRTHPPAPAPSMSGQNPPVQQPVSSSTQHAPSLAPVPSIDHEKYARQNGEPDR